MRPAVFWALEDDLIDYGSCFWEVVDKYSKFSITRIPPHKFYESMYTPGTNSSLTGQLHIN